MGMPKDFEFIETGSGYVVPSWLATYISRRVPPQFKLGTLCLLRRHGQFLVTVFSVKSCLGQLVKGFWYHKPQQVEGLLAIAKEHHVYVSVGGTSFLNQAPRTKRECFIFVRGPWVYPHTGSGRPFVQSSTSIGSVKCHQPCAGPRSEARR